MGNQNMKNMNNFCFVLLALSLSAISSISLRIKEDPAHPAPNPFEENVNKVWNEDLVGTEDEHGLWSYRKKGGDGEDGFDEDWQIEALRQSRIEEETEKANKTIANIPVATSWYVLINQLAAQVKVLQTKNITQDDWEDFDYIIKRSVLLGNERTHDSWQKIAEYLLKHAAECKKYVKPKKTVKKPVTPVKKPEIHVNKTKTCNKTEIVEVPQEVVPSDNVKRFIAVEEEVEGFC